MPDTTNAQAQGVPQFGAQLVDAKPDGRTNGLISIPWYLFFIALWQRTGQSQGGSVVPTGTVVDFAGEEVPVGWLECNGDAVSRESFSNLYTAIGTLWGPGDGLSTFNVPDLRQRFTRGADAGSPVGSTGGSDSITLGVGQLPSHSHGVTDPSHTHVLNDPGHNHNVNDPDHTHAVTDPGHTHAAAVRGTADVTTGASDGLANNGVTGSSSTGITIAPAATGVTIDPNTTGATVTAHVTGITIQNTGSGNPVDITPNFASLIKIIKT